MPAKSSATGQAKGPAETTADSPTVGKSTRRRAPSDATKAAPGAPVKVVGRNSGNGIAKTTAPTKSSAKQSGIKIERYSYKMPKSEHETIVALKEKLNEQGIKVKKSELIRAGMHLLVNLSDAKIKSSLDKISAVAVRAQKER